MPKTKSTTKQPKTASPKSTTFIRTVGRRKTSVARVRIHNAKGDNLVNDIPLNQYFPALEHQIIATAPMKTVNVLNKYHFTAKVTGGGIKSQAQAVNHGLARGLIQIDPDSKDNLKKKGLLTRDPRMKERRKAGYAQAARARKQSPKR